MARKKSRSGSYGAKGGNGRSLWIAAGAGALAAAASVPALAGGLLTAAPAGAQTAATPAPPNPANANIVVEEL